MRGSQVFSNPVTFMFVGFTKYDDTAAKASNSIQESELKSIRDFLDSVDLRCVCLYMLNMYAVVYVFACVCTVCMYVCVTHGLRIYYIFYEIPNLD